MAFAFDSTFDIFAIIVTCISARNKRKFILVLEFFWVKARPAKSEVISFFHSFRFVHRLSVLLLPKEGVYNCEYLRMFCIVAKKICVILNLFFEFSSFFSQNASYLTLRFLFVKINRDRAVRQKKNK